MSNEKDLLKNIRENMIGNILVDAMEYTAFRFGTEDKERLYRKTVLMLKDISTNYSLMAQNTDPEENQQFIVDLDTAYDRLLKRYNN